MSRVRRNWTGEEDALLRKLVNNEIENSRPLLWRELAKQIPGRSNKDCRKRWWNSLAEGTAKGPWSQEEDKRLIEAVWEHGTNWNQVARVVGSRYADQCSSHWSQVLDPDINHCDWTGQEDEQLLHAVLSHGTNWSTIAASHRPQRTTLALKNRYSTLRLRHQNAGSRRESPSVKTPVSPSIEVLNKTKPKKNRQDDRFNGNGDTEDEEGDEEGDEEVDEDGEEEGEEADEDDEERNRAMAEYGCSTFSVIPNRTSLGPHDLCVNKAPPNGKPNIAKTSDMWTGYTGAPPNKIQSNYRTPNKSLDQWMNVAMNNQTMYMSAGHPLYPGEGFLNTDQDGGGVDINMAFSGHVDEDAMNIDFGNFQESLFPESESPNHGNLIISGNCITPPANSFPRVDIAALSPESLKDTTNSPPKEGGGNPNTLQAALHQVSINLACTTDQLSNVMTWLATTGLAVNIKIDSQV